MKKHILSYCIYFITIIMIVSCSKEKRFDCIRSTGDIVKQERYFDNFSVIYVEDNIDVVLLQDMPGKIVVEAGENLLYKIKTFQEGNKITISNENTCNWVRSYHKKMRVLVGVGQVKEIDLFGYGTITSGGHLRTDTLRVYNLTYGDADIQIDADFVGFIADDHSTIKLKGISNKIAGSCAKNALVDTREMNTRWAVITNNSMLDSYIYCDSLIQAETQGDGNIICTGHPGKVKYNALSGNGDLKFE